MKRKNVILTLLLTVSLLCFTGCGLSFDTYEELQEKEQMEKEKTQKEAETILTACKYKGMTVEEILSSLTLEMKAAQMVQPAIYAVTPELMRKNCYGGILTKSEPLSATDWQKLVDSYQIEALNSEAGVPYLYGQDDVHGVNYALNTVIFPHNIGLGAANDPELMYEMGRITAEEAALCHMTWNFGPVVAQSVDPRWGRTYESFGSDLGIITELSTQYTKGFVKNNMIACAKHFFADGNVVYGTGENSDVNRLIDRGDAKLTEEEIDALLKVYQAQIDAGVQTIMISHSSLNGVKMHENAKYIQYLKNEMGFQGFIVSDWDSIQNTSGQNYREQVINCVNSGIDMLMEVTTYNIAKDIIVEAVNSGKIEMERVDDAVRRILSVKMEAAVIDDPLLLNLETKAQETGTEDNRQVAETLVEESLVLIKNENNILPLQDGVSIYVTGPAMDSARIQCGGWTMDWNGSETEDISGVTTILEGLEQVTKGTDSMLYTDPKDAADADVVLLVVGEETYAEWNGDTPDLDLCGELGLGGNKQAIEEAKALGKPIITCIVAGRHVLIRDYEKDWDGVVMCYLPGSEGQGIAKVLFGKSDFKGKLPSPWYDSIEQIGSDQPWLDIGYGLNYVN